MSEDNAVLGWVSASEEGVRDERRLAPASCLVAMPLLPSEVEGGSFDVT